MTWQLIVLLAVASVFAGVRFTIPTRPLSLAGTYQAFAHLFVGGLIGAYTASGEWPLLLLLIGLTGVEVVAFVMGRRKSRGA